MLDGWICSWIAELTLLTAAEATATAFAAAPAAMAAIGPGMCIDDDEVVAAVDTGVEVTVGVDMDEPTMIGAETIPE